ncbi:MAG: Eco57I restriction-modification methylase domain-containing protein [Polaromonas sp.]
MTHSIELIEDIEELRLTLQAQLDAKKTQSERNKLGQFATPTALARDVLAYGLALLPQASPVRFLDPAIGTGSFYAALRAMSSERRMGCATGYEIDPHYGEPAKTLWAQTALDYQIADFTRLEPPRHQEKKSNLLICNPPYVRHHHIAGHEKLRLHAMAKGAANISLSGLAGLYCYFMALAHAWMDEGGIAGWLIPSEFMDVNYGRALKEYLLRDVTLLHIHRFDPNDVQFDDALVSSAVVWFRKDKPPVHHRVRFSYGGPLARPALSKIISIEDLRSANKWTRFPKNDPVQAQGGYRLADLFSIKRGIATGANSFFILPEERAHELNLPLQFLKPILPSSRHVKEDEILCDASGAPLLSKRLYLLDCDLPEEQVKQDFPSLWEYLKTGKETVAQAYLCKSRKHWYAQEKRFAAPIICTYLGRSDTGRPFRFLLNSSQAIATNVYLMLYPQPLLARQLAVNPLAIRALWKALNAIQPETLLGEGRVYGGGLHKLEPKELANVPADDLAAIMGLGKKVEAAHQLDFSDVLTA